MLFAVGEEHSWLRRWITYYWDQCQKADAPQVVLLVETVFNYTWDPLNKFISQGLGILLAGNNCFENRCTQNMP